MDTSCARLVVLRSGGLCCRDGVVVGDVCGEGDDGDTEAGEEVAEPGVEDAKGQRWSSGERGGAEEVYMALLVKMGDWGGENGSV